MEHFAASRSTEVMVVDSTEEILEQIADESSIAAAAESGLPPVSPAEVERRGDPTEPTFALF